MLKVSKKTSNPSHPRPKLGGTRPWGSLGSPFAICETLGRSHEFLEPHVPHLENGGEVMGNRLL